VGERGRETDRQSWQCVNHRSQDPMGGLELSPQRKVGTGAVSKCPGEHSFTPVGDMVPLVRLAPPSTSPLQSPCVCQA
jgi:hypothetical protein